MSDYTEPIVLPPDDDTAGLPVPPQDYVPPFDPEAPPVVEQDSKPRHQRSDKD